MKFLMLIVLIFVVYACVYNLANRICKCIERYATAKSFNKFAENMKVEQEEKTDGGERTEA